MDGLAVKLRPSSPLRGKQFIARGIVNHRCDAFPFPFLSLMFQSLMFQSMVFQSNRHAKHRKSVREVRRSIERIDIPAILAALVAESLLFAQNIVRRPLLPDPFADQHLGSAVSRRHQVSIALVFDLQMLMEVLHQQSTRFASDRRHGRKKAVGSVRRCHPERNKHLRAERKRLCSRRTPFRLHSYQPRKAFPPLPSPQTATANPKPEARKPKPDSLPLPAVFRDIHDLVLKNEKV